MEVPCPQCNTLNESVDSQHRDVDHLMTCIRCGGQFRVIDDVGAHPEQDFDEDVTGIDLDTMEPRALSVRIPLDQVDWRETDDSLSGSSVSLGPAVQNVRRGRPSMPTPAPTPTPAESSSSGGSENTSDSLQDRWTWRDLTLALTAVFDRRRFMVSVLGLWAVLIIHGLVKWFAVWAGTRNSGLGTLFSLIAAAILIVLFILVSSVCSVICQTDLIEERPITVSEAVQWTKNWTQSVLGTPLAFVAVVASAVIIEAIFGFLGRIPFVGAPLWGVFTPVTIICSLIGGLAVVALVYSLPIYIPVIYNERTSALDTLNRLLELLREQGVRIIGSLLGMLALTAGAAAIVLYPAWYIGMQLSTRVATSTMGPSLTNVVSEVPGPFIPGAMSFLDVTELAGPGPMDASHTIGGVLMGTLATIGPALLMGTFTLVLCASGCIIYSMVTGRRKV